jgi:hypothetical protein
MLQKVKGYQYLFYVLRAVFEERIRLVGRRAPALRCRTARITARYFSCLAYSLCDAVASPLTVIAPFVLFGFQQCVAVLIVSNSNAVCGVCRVLVGNSEGQRPLGRSRRRWEDNIKMNLQEVGLGLELD